MSKVFRIYKGGAATLEGWQSTPAYPYNSTARDTINDPDGASAAHEITSIPSPLARIDLIKTAFAEVVKNGPEGLDGNSIFHKMVSDTLDVAEIFFNRNKIGDKIEIIKWTPEGMRERLGSSSSAGHRYLADALSKYLNADASTYNFDRLQGVYMLNYPSGPDELNIIGATSPATLFFSNANDLTFVDDIYLGQRRPFSRSEFVALHRRDPEMIRYMMALRASIPSFATLFPEVDTYLTVTYRALTDEALKDEIRGLDAAYPEAFYTPIEVVDATSSNMVEVLGHLIFTKKGMSALDKSEMAIAATIPQQQPPLVLPVEAGNRYSSLLYASAPWGTSHAAPVSEPETDLSKRVLPFDGARYPWLTIGDLLEDNLVAVCHSLNRALMFDGNIGKMKREELAYLIPVKPLLFRYFSIDDIINTRPGCHPLLSMDQLAGDAVKVTLRIPVNGNGRVDAIEYSRIYYPNRKASPDKNEGAIVNLSFTGVMTPPVKTPAGVTPIYNVTSVDATGSNIKFDFYKHDTAVVPTSVTQRDTAREHNVKGINYLLEGSEWDYIRVSDGASGASGLLIPRLPESTAARRIDFAVDLGTSNTHIECRVDEAPFSTGLQYETGDSPAARFFTPSLDREGAMLDLHDESALIDKDLLPATLGHGDFRFPTRTVLSAPKKTVWNKEIAPLTTVNLPFTYDKRRPLPYNTFHTDIKWGAGDSLDIMETYVNTLMLIMRNKALTDGGDLRQTRLCWFFPASMPPKRLRRLRRVWDEAFRHYFNPDGTTTAISESQAPAAYFYRSVSTATSMVNIDIGGGTTDIAYSADGRVKLFTSFRMGANALFEDTFSDINTANAIVDRHKDDILATLRSMNLTELIHIFNSPVNKRPANMASFLFGLRDNTIAAAAGVKPSAIDFNFKLQEDEDFKIVFILFYASIIYHVGKIISTAGLNLPRHISFSGNGSRILSIITTDVAQLTQFTRLMLEEASGLSYGDSRLEILGLAPGTSPKESTCKGGIMSTPGDSAVNDAGNVVLVDSKTGFAGTAATYRSMTDSRQQAVVNDVNDFIAFVDRINSMMNLDDNFGVKPLSLAAMRDIPAADLATFVAKGLKSRLNESDPDDSLEETPFFYPVKGLLNAISTEIGQKLKQ